MSRLLVRLPVALPLIIFFLIVGCDGLESSEVSSGQVPDQPVLATTEVQNLNGEEIYQAFVFARGPVVDIFPEIFGDISYATMVDTMSSSDAAQFADDIEGVTEQELADAWASQEELSPAEVDQLVSTLLPEVIDEVRANDPDYFETLEAKMKSGDHLQVQDALASIGEVTVPAMAKVLDVSEDVIRGMALPSPEFVDTFAVGLAYVAVLVAGALMVTTVALVNSFKVATVETSSSVSLENEMVVDLIVDRLRT